MQNFFKHLFQHKHKYSNERVSWWEKWDETHTYLIARRMTFDCISCGYHYAVGWDMKGFIPSRSVEEIIRIEKRNNATP